MYYESLLQCITSTESDAWHNFQLYAFKTKYLQSHNSSAIFIITYIEVSFWSIASSVLKYQLIAIMINVVIHKNIYICRIQIFPSIAIKFFLINRKLL